MNVKVDLRQQPKGSVGSLEPSHLWVLGLTVDDDRPLAGPGMRPYSFWADCECPGDCLRDHENE